MRDTGGASAPSGAKPGTPRLLDSTSSAAADDTLQEGDLLRDVHKEMDEKTGASHRAQGTSSSAPPSPSKVLGVVKNSAPPSPSKVLGVVKNCASSSSPPPSPPKVVGVVKNSASSSSSPPPSPSKVLGVGNNSAPSSPTSAARTSPSALAKTQEASAADAQGPQAASAEMAQTMTGLLDPSHKKLEPLKLRRDFAINCRLSDADPLHGGVMDDPAILASGYIKILKDDYLYKLTQLDRLYTVPNGDKTEEFNTRVETKKSIRDVLKFLQVEKRNVHDDLKKLPMYKALIESLMPLLENIESDECLRTMCWKESQQQLGKPTDASTSFPINSSEGQVQREGAEKLVAETPFDRLRHAVRSSSPAGLHSSVLSMWSVLRESDRVLRGNVGDFPDSTSLFGSMDECGVPESSRVRSLKRQKMQNANYTVFEEIEAMNRLLIDTEITIADDSGTDRATSSCDGTIIKLSYTAVAVSPGLRSVFASYEMGAVMPAKLYVPPDYPRSSPKLIIDKGDDLLRKKCSPIADSVHMAFPLALSGLPEPHSIKDIANAWDTCVRSAVTKFAQQSGGGTFSSRFGGWERCDG